MWCFARESILKDGSVRELDKSVLATLLLLGNNLEYIIRLPLWVVEEIIYKDSNLAHADKFEKRNMVCIPLIEPDSYSNR